MHSKCTGKRDKEMEEGRSGGGHEKRVSRVEEGYRQKNELRKGLKG